MYKYQLPYNIHINVPDIKIPLQKLLNSTQHLKQFPSNTTKLYPNAFCTTCTCCTHVVHMYTRTSCTHNYRCTCSTQVVHTCTCVQHVQHNMYNMYQNVSMCTCICCTCCTCCSVYNIYGCTQCWGSVPCGVLLVACTLT